MDHGVGRSLWPAPCKNERVIHMNFGALRSGSHAIYDRLRPAPWSLLSNLSTAKLLNCLGMHLNRSNYFKVLPNLVLTLCSLEQWTIRLLGFVKHGKWAVNKLGGHMIDSSAEIVKKIINLNITQTIPQSPMSFCTYSPHNHKFTISVNHKLVKRNFIVNQEFVVIFKTA